MLLTADTCIELIWCAGQKFSGNDYIFALCKVPERPAHILLTGTALISDGRIVEIDAEFQTAFDNVSGMFLIDSPPVLTSAGISKAHTAHADAGYVQIRISKFRVFHCVSSCDC